MTETYSWYAVYTKSRAEKKVVEALNALGIKNYLPLKTVERKWKDRKKKIDMPVIASYVFVYIKLIEQRTQLYEIPGFVAFVSEKRAPKPIPEKEIETMKKTIESSWTFELNTDTLVKGQKVVLRRPPLDGVEGIIKDFSTKKVHIVLPSVGMTFIVNIEDADFETL